MKSQKRSKGHTAGGGGGPAAVSVQQGNYERADGSIRKEANGCSGKFSPPRKTDLMVDLNVVESGGKEETPRKPILWVFSSTKGGNQVGFLVHNGPQV